MLKIVAFLLLFSSVALASRGGMVGNGGDLIRCEASSANPLVGYYTLDYVASYASSSKPIPDSADPLQDILMSIWNRRVDEHGGATNMRWLFMSLATFAESARIQIFSEPNYVLSNIWINESLGLIDIEDEELIQKIPENCKTGKTLSLTQAVIRRPSGQSTIFHFDNAAWPKLTTPYQNSYLIIHEWLRGITEDAQVIRDTNRLLHSVAFRDAKPEDALLMLKNVSGSEYGPEVDQKFLSSFQYTLSATPTFKEYAVPFYVTTTFFLPDAPSSGAREYNSFCYPAFDTEKPYPPDEVPNISCAQRAGIQVVPGQTLWYYGPKGAAPVAIAHVSASKMDFRFK